MLRDTGTVRLGRGRVGSATQQHSPGSAQLRPARGCLMLAERERRSRGWSVADPWSVADQCGRAPPACEVPATQPPPPLPVNKGGAGLRSLALAACPAPAPHGQASLSSVKQRPRPPPSPLIFWFGFSCSVLCNYQPGGRMPRPAWGSLAGRWGRKRGARLSLRPHSSWADYDGSSAKCLHSPFMTERWKRRCDEKCAD